MNGIVYVANVLGKIKDPMEIILKLQMIKQVHIRAGLLFWLFVDLFGWVAV